MSTPLVLPELPPYTAQSAPTCCAASSAVNPIPPCYSVQPREDEEVVAFTPRMYNNVPQGTFIRRWPQATLILKDQEEGARLPTYGRNGRIIGELGLKNTEKIIKVTVKVRSSHIWSRLSVLVRDNTRLLEFPYLTS